MFKEIKKEINWNGNVLSIETGKIARQADASILTKMGNTTVLCTLTVAKSPLEGVDFLPLTVNYVEKFYAAGRIPGGFFKRESKPSDNATLISRLIDRPIRPLFPSNFYNEVSITCTLLSYDAECSPDIVSIIGASAAIALSGIPFESPIAGARVGYINNEYVLNPNYEKLKTSNLDLVVAGTNSSVLMVESEAKELSKDIMLGAVNFGHEQIQPVIQMIEDLRSESTVNMIDLVTVNNEEIKKEIYSFAEQRIAESYTIMDKKDRSLKLETIKQSIIEKFSTDDISESRISSIIKNLEKDIVRTNILKNHARIDGRKTDEIRAISAEVGLLPKVHGSALFTRGETQALVITTVASSKFEQMVDGVENNVKKESFMLHYNFPPYCVGETGPLRPPGRREIGHGKLALRSINSIIPSQEEFPYVTRVVSEITESNGSSSMATVCGASLSLMDAGIPFKKLVSGIAMGLIKENDEYVILSDIMGDEDHLGDMDFKVAGTEDGITALQMDIKISGINSDIMSQALSQAELGRLYILKKMSEVISSPRKELNDNIPRIQTVKISPKKVKDLIGPKGRVVKGICESTKSVIDIEDDGTVKIVSENQKTMEQAISMVNDAICEPEIGVVYEGEVVKIVEAGAFIKFFNGKEDGFLHISQLDVNHVDSVEDVINEGDIIKIKLIGFDKKRGRPKLRYYDVDQETGETIPEEILEEERDSRNNNNNNKRKGGFLDRFRK